MQQSQEAHHPVIYRAIHPPNSVADSSLLLPVFGFQEVAILSVLLKAFVCAVTSSVNNGDMFQGINESTSSSSTFPETEELIC
mmetsp:Transcript_9299/g.13915  ORF Transcript_9299/g.13915 Transcript_9299/m.13915 type:complete len:83 (+) Transcript_9299:250-498(+)